MSKNFFIRKSKSSGEGSGTGRGHGRPKPSSEVNTEFKQGKRRLGNTDYKGPRGGGGGNAGGRGRGRGRGGSSSKRPFQGQGGVPGQKKPKFDPWEEIESSSDGDDDDDEVNEGSKAKGQDGDDQDSTPFMSIEETETPQERKVRLAKVYLEEIEREERSRQAETEDIDPSIGVAARLKEYILEAEGRLRKEVSHSIRPDIAHLKVLQSPKYLKKAVTCLCISPDDLWIYSGSKDGLLIKWSIPKSQKESMVKPKEKLSRKRKKQGKTLKPGGGDPNSIHSSPILAIAISSDGKFLATGDAERQIVIWNPETLKRIHVFKGHRGAIRGLVFRKKTHTLYSSSEDRSLRIWSLDEMGYVETLFGHQDAVTCVDALTRERAISGGGRDNSVRVWKIVEESQLVYNGHYSGSIDAVKLINEENFLSAGDDGCLSTWNVNRKKPLFTVPHAHGLQAPLESDGIMGPSEGNGCPSWLSSIAAWTNTDLVASGSCDGMIRFWRCGDRFKSLTELTQVHVPGWINCMEFSHGPEIESKFLAIGTGKEHKLGRWFSNIKEARNSIVIIPLSSSQPDLNGADDEDH